MAKDTPIFDKGFKIKELKEKTTYTPIAEIQGGEDNGRVIWGNLSIENRAYRFSLVDPSMAEYFGSSIIFPEHNFYIRRDQGKIHVMEGTIGTHLSYNWLDLQPSKTAVDGSLIISKIDESTAKRLIEFARTGKSNETVEKDLETLLR